MCSCNIYLLCVYLLQGQGSDSDTLAALTQLREIVMASDISPFEVNHSGLIRSLLQFLTRNTDNLRDERLRAFLHVFANCPVSSFPGNYFDVYSKKCSII